MLAMVLCGSAGCNSLTKNALRPCEIPIEAIPESRSRRVPLDHRHLGAPIEHEHRVMAGDVLGVYIADIVGKRDELPQVSYPSFRTKNAPIEPFVGLPFKVESDGTLHLPYVDAIHVEGLTIPDVREAIIHTYVADKKLIKPGRDNVAVSLITRSITGSMLSVRTLVTTFRAFKHLTNLKFHDVGRARRYTLSPRKRVF
jgi:protein involved in polysaccharide export with SLBB domain